MREIKLYEVTRNAGDSRELNWGTYATLEEAQAVVEKSMTTFGDELFAITEVTRKMIAIYAPN